MTQLIMWMVAAYGMTTILVYGSIFNGLRNWIHRNAEPTIKLKLTQPIFVFLSSLIKCMLCTGTWVGFFMSFTSFSPWHELIGFDRSEPETPEMLLAMGVAPLEESKFEMNDALFNGDEKTGFEEDEEDEEEDDYGFNDFENGYSEDDYNDY